MYMGFSSPELTGPAITDYLTRVVQPLLATVPGVAAGRDPGRPALRDARLARSRPRMAARGISAADVQAAIQANNFQSAPGQAKGYFTVINIIADTGLTSLDDFRAMVVKAEDGGAGPPARHRHGRAGRAEQQLARCTMNGQHAVFIGVNATPTGNPLEHRAGVRELLPTHRARPAADRAGADRLRLRPGSSSPRSTRCADDAGRGGG